MPAGLYFAVSGPALNTALVKPRYGSYISIGGSMKLEVRNISVGSLVTSSVPLVIFCLALLGGIITFMVVPNLQLSPMSSFQKILSVGLYALLYVIISTAVLVFASFVYNVFTGVLGLRGVVFDIEEIHHD